MTDEVRARRFYLISQFFWDRIDEAEVPEAFNVPLDSLVEWDTSSINPGRVGTENRALDTLNAFREHNWYKFDGETLDLVDQVIAGLSLRSSSV